MGWFNTRHGPQSESIALSRAEYDRLIRRDRHLSYLEANGIDNWDGYVGESLALEALIKEELVEAIIEDNVFDPMRENIIEEEILENEMTAEILGDEIDDGTFYDERNIDSDIVW